jgi:hypothetical protein
MFRRVGMSKLELIAHELEGLPEKHTERLLPMIWAESSLAKDWLTPEEGEAWMDL